MIMSWSEEDQAYIVSVPELPGCMADGKYGWIYAQICYGDSIGIGTFGINIIHSSSSLSLLIGNGVFSFERTIEQ